MKCPKYLHENPEDTYFWGMYATRIRPLGGESFSRTMTLETSFKVLSRGKIFADKYQIVGEIGEGDAPRIERIEEETVFLDRHLGPAKQ